jgi:hypothetical protein
LLEDGELGGCFVYVVIKIAIHLNLAAAGKSYTEENQRVKQARDQAKKSSHFDSLPLEFILLHEQQHAKEMAKALGDIAAQAINCSLGDSAKDIAALNKQLQDAADALYQEAADGVQGEVERRIREATWNEWDRLHP